jgi:hypothetical protein
VKPTLENQQRDYFSGNWMGGAVAKELLSKSFAHWTYFQTMLDDFFMEFAVNSVISDTVSGVVCPKPLAGRLTVPQVLETCPGVYHGSGLLPLNHMHG